MALLEWNSSEGNPFANAREVGARTCRAVAVLLLAPLTAVGSPTQGITSRLSVDSSGNQGNATSGGPLSFTGDGRLVAFTSWASNLVAGDTNGAGDIFIHDRATSTTARVSVDGTGQQGNANCNWPTLSENGQYVGFCSAATNLIVGDTNAQADVFIKDLQSGLVVRASIGTQGNQTNGFSGAPMLSGDGAAIVFQSQANNILPNDFNNVDDIFLYDRLTGAIRRVSVDSGGNESDGVSFWPAISLNGKLIAFGSTASNLVLGDTNGSEDVFVHELGTGQTTRVSVSSSGLEGNRDSRRPWLSPDGRLVAFQSIASNLVFGDTNNHWDIFVYDRMVLQVKRVSVSAFGIQANRDCQWPVVSADGRFVAFSTEASTITVGDTNLWEDIFVHDRQTLQMSRVSVATSGTQTNQASGFPAIDASGGVVVFQSWASNLVVGDTNGALDVFDHDRGTQCGTAVAYCTVSTSVNGCSAWMRAVGVPRVAAPTGFVLQCWQLDGGRSAAMFYGVNGRQSLPWAVGSTSHLCVALPLQRTPVQDTTGSIGQCDGSIAMDWLAYMSNHPNALGQPMFVGLVIDAQTWYRDPQAPKNSNLSDAIEFDLCP